MTQPNHGLAVSFWDAIPVDRFEESSDAPAPSIAFPPDLSHDTFTRAIDQTPVNAILSVEQADVG